MKPLKKTTTQIVMLSCLSIFFMISTLSFAQQTKNTLFANADKAMLNAQQVQADILVPLTYTQGVNNYKDAEKSFKKEQGIKEVEASLVQAVNYFNRSVDFSVSAKLVFANTLDARRDALSAGADKFAKGTWQEAEEEFYDAAKALEKGDRDDSYEYSTEAIKLYRKAELRSIKTDLLDETRALLKKADDMKVDRNAPKTIKRATSLLKETEKELETSRYDMDYPRTLAKQAKYEASHAIYLDKTIAGMDDRDMEMEDVILSYEMPLTRIAERVGFVAQFDQGVEIPENRIINYVTNLQKKNGELGIDNIVMENKIMDLESNIALLKKENEALNRQFRSESMQQSEAAKLQMKEFENEKARLDAKLKKQAQIDKQFENVYMIFDSTEASVIRSGDDIVVRMHGFGFDVGKSEIKPENFDLLTKVQNAIKIFPESTVIVEGYTDSFGGDALNLKLSQDRSDAVTQYLNANAENSRRIKSVGYGENNPVANNETKEGRKQNRRIDIRIQPKL